MDNAINWGRLFTQGRCKNIGIPWSDEEANAVFILKVPAEFVRRGCLTVEAYEAMQKKDKSAGKTHETMSDDELRAECLKVGLVVTDAAPRSVLLEELSKSTSKQTGFVCDVCDKAAKTAAGLAAHKRSHS